MSIHLILKNIQGDFLAQISDVAGQVTIGSDPICDLQIPDDEVKPEQLRFSQLNGDLWLQVPDTTETVKIEDKNVREAKISASTVVFFKDYFIEVLFKIEDTVSRGQTISSNITSTNLTTYPGMEEILSEKASQDPTRVVDLSLDKTRIAAPQEAPKFDEATRLVKTDEATRVVSSQVSTRVAKSREQNFISESMREALQKSRSRVHSAPYQTNDFPAVFKKITEDLLDKLKKVPSDKARNVGFGVGIGIFMILVLVSFKKSETQFVDLKEPTQSPAVENSASRTNVLQKRDIRTVSKDFYLQELDKLFIK